MKLTSKKKLKDSSESEDKKFFESNVRKFSEAETQDEERPENSIFSGYTFIFIGYSVNLSKLRSELL